MPADDTKRPATARPEKPARGGHPPTMRRLLLLALPLFALDQATKWAVLHRFFAGASLEVIPGFFNLVHVTNTGAAFGMFKGANTFFIALNLVAIVFITAMQWRGHLADRWTHTACGLLLSGILGNLTDRLIHGHVIDFLDFHIGEHHWPAFNVADSCICIAAAILVLRSFFPGHTAQPASPPA